VKIEYRTTCSEDYVKGGDAGNATIKITVVDKVAAN
jgi:hypothetical protein